MVAPIALMVGIIALAFIIRYRSAIFLVLIGIIMWLSYLNQQNQQRYDADIRCINQLTATGIYRGQAEVDCATELRPSN